MMDDRARTQRYLRRGMTLAEAAVAMLILAVAATATLPLASAASRNARRASEVREADRVADAVLRWHVRLPFEDPLVPGLMGLEAGEAPSLPATWDDVDDASGWSGSAPAWTDPAGLWTIAIRVSWASTTDAAGAVANDSGLKRVDVVVLRESRPVSTRRAIVARPRVRTYTRRRRRGSAHLAALGFALLMATTAMGAILVSRALLRVGSDARDSARAGYRAADGFAWAMSELEDSASDLDSGNASFTLSSSADDSSLTVTSTIGVAPGLPALCQPVRLSVAATSGFGIRSFTAEAFPVRRPFSALERPLAVAGQFGISGAGSLTIADGEGVIGSSRSPVPVAVVNLTTLGSTLQDSLRRRQALVRFPSVDDLEALADLGTELDFETVEKTGSRILLTPRHTLKNQACDKRGVYVIDCKGETISLSDVRVVGTLLIIDPGPGSRLRDGLVFEPAVPGYPALVVIGTIELAPTTTLSENSGSAVNFNPSGAPMPFVGGTVDTDTSDTFLSRFGGPVIVTGALQVTSPSTFQGLVVGDGLGVTATVTVATDPWIAASPPEPLCDRHWMIDSSTLRRVVSE